MNIRRITARTAVAGITTALAAGAFVGITTTAADAATGTAQYNCTNGFTSDVLPLTLSATADLASFPPFATGFSVPEDIVGVDLVIGLSPEAVAGLKANHIDSVGATSTGMNFPFGSSAAPLKGFDIAPAALPETGGFEMGTHAVNAPFALPNPGAVALKMPAAFSLTNVIPIPLDCTVAGEQQTITTYTVTKQSATVTAPAKKVRKNKPFSIVANVVGQYKAATGKVSVKLGTKTLGTGIVKSGKATVKIAKGLKKTANVTVVYAGDKSTNGAKSAPVKITVK
jgi:hypothetical protein